MSINDHNRWSFDWMASPCLLSLSLSLSLSLPHSHRRPQTLRVEKMRFILFSLKPFLCVFYKEKASIQFW